MPQRAAAGALDVRAAPPQRVACRRLRAHQIRAEVRQQLGAVDGAFVGEVEDADPVQGAGRISHAKPVAVG